MRQVIHKRLPTLVLLAVFAFTLSFGFVVAKHRYQALNGNNIDYSFFLQFTVKAFSSSLSHELSINPYNRGENMFFIAGPDGSPMWRWLHTETIKIIPTLLYTATNSLLVSYCFYIFFFFFPLLYGAYLVWDRERLRGTVALALVALALYPASFLNATDYLRPYSLLLPFFICFFLSILYRRPFTEKIIFLLLLLSVREEALSFVAAILSWDLLRNRRDMQPQKYTFTLWSMWALWCIGTIFYYVHSGYGFNPPLSPTILFLGLFLGLSVFGTTCWWLWKKGEGMWRFAPEIVFAVTALGPIVIFLVGIDPHATSQGIRIVYSRNGITLFYVLIALLVAHLYDQQKELVKKISVLLLSLCITLSIIYEVIPHPSATLSYISRWDAMKQDDALVYRAASHIPEDTPVLLDMATMVAFYNHNNTYAYNYLPYKLSSSTGPGFPENITPLRTLVSSQEISYAVLLNSDAEPLLDILKKSGKTVTLTEHNEQFSLYQIK